MLLIITSTSDELLRNVNIDDLTWPWILKILVFSDFLVIFGCKKVNCDGMDRDRPRSFVNRKCYRLSRVSWALAQISCCSWERPQKLQNSTIGCYLLQTKTKCRLLNLHYTSKDLDDISYATKLDYKLRLLKSPKFNQILVH